MKTEKSELVIGRRGLIATALGLGAAGLAPVAARASDGKGPTPTSLSPDQALQQLMDGNRKFVADKGSMPAITKSRRLELTNGQAPFCAIVGCADSRVSLEHLFGAGLGELFVVRTAGNYVDDAGLGSLAYAVAALKVPLIVVLGHEKCGAVDAARDMVEAGTRQPKILSDMLEPILPAVISAKMQSPEDLLTASIDENVRMVVSELRGNTDPILRGPMDGGKLKIVGATYSLSSGAVNFHDMG